MDGTSITMQLLTSWSLPCAVTPAYLDDLQNMPPIIAQRARVVAVACTSGPGTPPDVGLVRAVRGSPRQPTLNEQDANFYHMNPRGNVMNQEPIYPPSYMDNRPAKHPDLPNRALPRSGTTTARGWETEPPETSRSTSEPAGRCPANCGGFPVPLSTAGKGRAERPRSMPRLHPPESGP